MSALVSKEDAHRLVDQLPANATWDDLMHEIYDEEIGRMDEKSREPI